MGGVVSWVLTASFKKPCLSDKRLLTYPSNKKQLLKQIIFIPKYGIYFALAKDNTLQVGIMLSHHSWRVFVMKLFSLHLKESLDTVENDEKKCYHSFVANAHKKSTKFFSLTCFIQLLNSMLQCSFVFDADNGTILCMLYDMRRDMIITAGVGGVKVCAWNVTSRCWSWINLHHTEYMKQNRTDTFLFTGFSTWRGWGWISKEIRLLPFYLFTLVVRLLEPYASASALDVFNHLWNKSPLCPLWRRPSIDDLENYQRK